MNGVDSVAAKHKPPLSHELSLNEMWVKFVLLFRQKTHPKYD